MSQYAPHKKGAKPRIYTFQPDAKQAGAWNNKWINAGFTPVVLPRDIGFRPDKVASGDGVTSLLQLKGSEKLIESFKTRIDPYVERIKARPNAPSLDGYFRWLWTAIAARDDQYVFMTQPDIFPGDIQTKGLLTEAMCRHATAEKLILLAGSDAVMGTKTSFLKMCDLLVGDYGVTAENATDGYIVRRVQDQMMDFIVELPCCKDHGADGWEQSPLVRWPDYKLPTFDFQTAFTEASCKSS